ncbi:hypothetical protein [Streptomyces aureus]
MGIRLFVEVLEHAPEALTWRERYALAVLAENANDNTRECWPGIEDDPAIAHRMRLPGRSSRYEVLKALRSKGALESVTAGHRGRRAVYRIPALGPAEPAASDPGKGPGFPDAMDEKGSGVSGQRVREPRTQTSGKRPETADPNGKKGSGNDPERVREPHGKGPETTDPYSSYPSEEQQEATAPGTRQITAEEKLEFGRFWQLHPKSRDMDKTRTEWIAAVLVGADPKQITTAAQAYAHEAAGTEFRFVKQSANWLRERRYEDKYEPAPAKPKPSRPLPPWCGECADGARAAEREGHLRQIYDDRGNAHPCPKCHPSTAIHAA